MAKPPQLPEFIAARLVRLAKLDGWLLLSVAGCFAVVSAVFGDWPGALGGAVAAGAGYFELRGAARIASGHSSGLRWLIAGQSLLLAAILGYCAWRLQRPDYVRLEQSLPPQARQLAENAGVSLRELVRLVYPLVYEVLALVSVLYQGGMILHYLRARPALKSLDSAR